ncbi:3-methyladenine DNA glycosylase [Acaricomes phytoseiuli]|uniref:3-methyladenine DNA glycosylase n=1 Tax=Acaricomes phytoseiuli TaxID=291968 RepID=UPI0022235B6B|nr:3-methyladenine DNA glycosylase [Acaricomes phytoseiuli]MCW1249338.1 3-methyladenine DNA glycosylase [Acaricomes phytoseiuli]
MRTALAPLQAAEWLPLAHAHETRVDRYAKPYLERRSRGEKHPVEDFLFTYYTLKPAQLRRWHPGSGVVLLGEAARERQQWRFYRGLTDAERAVLQLDAMTPAVTVDTEDFLAARQSAVDFTTIILAGTASRPAQFGCFGLHEWAMAYRSEDNGIRHEYLPLRLGAAGTDEVVESHRIRCTHFDAFRFYTPQAAPLNELTPSRENQRILEQPGCLHANMDLYKWAYKLLPLLPSELLMDAFELSWRIRTMDMQAAPYDLADWGYAPIRIETAEGKAEYVTRQRDFAQEAAALRSRLLNDLEPRVHPANRKP